MIIRVTQEHIDAGVHRSHWSCPIALALKDAGMGSPAVWGSCLAFSQEGRRVVHRNSLAVRRFVEMFDSEEAKGMVAPFEFEV